MSLFNLQISHNKITLQPYLEFERKGLKLLLPALLTTFFAILFPCCFFEKPEIEISLFIFSALLIIWALYLYFMKSKTSIEFNKTEGYVYKIYFGFYRSKLLKISEIHSIDGILYNCSLQYCITNKNDRYGKNYSISGYFDGKTAEKTEFENIVLPQLEKFIETK